MKNLAQFLLFTILFSFSVVAQNDKTEETSSKNFDTFNPNEGDRPNQFLTTYLRTHKRLNLNRDIKKVLTNTNKYDYAVYSLRPEIGFGSGTSSLTSIYLDDIQIFGEGINRLYVIQDTRTDEIEKITRSSVNYDKKIKMYSKKYIESLK